jgi:hypothetical protein
VAKKKRGRGRKFHAAGGDGGDGGIAGALNIDNDVNGDGVPDTGPGSGILPELLAFVKTPLGIGLAAVLAFLLYRRFRKGR